MNETNTEETSTEVTNTEVTNTEETNTEKTSAEVTNMKELIEYIAKSIVDSSDDVVVTEETDEHGITLKLQVADMDKGRVIGKHGRIAEAMRTLLRVKAAKAGTRATLEII